MKLPIEPGHLGTMSGPLGPSSFKENRMNVRKNAVKDSANTRKKEGVLEKIARAIDPPSREVSDAELIDPGKNTPTAKPDHPPGSNASRSETRHGVPNQRDTRDK